MEYQSIGTRIKQRRNDLGLKQLQIKDETGISSGNLSDIENGKKLPSTPALISLSKILDCSVDWILTGETPKSENTVLSDEREEGLLKNFRELDQDSQEEIMDIIFMKLRRLKRASKNMARSSNSELNQSDKLA